MGNTKQNNSVSPKSPHDGNVKTSETRSVKISQTHVAIISSPLPPPEVLEKYAEIDPSFPERLMQMVEKEQKHRHCITFLGELFGFVVVIGGFVSAIVLGLYGKEWLAGTIGLGAISSIVGAYFYGKRKAIKEIKEKS